jgi:hypothetical protein
VEISGSGQYAAAVSVRGPDDRNSGIPGSQGSGVSGSQGSALPGKAEKYGAERADSVKDKVDIRGKPAGKDGSGKTAENDKKVAAEVQKLKQREQHVIAHEQAHMAAGGQYSGAVSYEYTEGPDGKRYISGGEVSIDVSEEKEPEATIRKMQQVRAAALAPSDPSSQDQSVAAAASQKESQARMEVAKKTYEQISGKGNGEGAGEISKGQGQASGQKGAGEVSGKGQAKGQGVGNGANDIIKTISKYA